MKIVKKIIRFILVFFILSILYTIIREEIPALIFLWALIAGGYALWEFGLLKKKKKVD